MLQYHGAQSLRVARMAKMGTAANANQGPDEKDLHSPVLPHSSLFLLSQLFFSGKASNKRVNIS